MTKDFEHDQHNARAVAIRDEARRRGEGQDPHITAKGRGHNAEKILRIAFDSGVKVRQDSELTDLLDAFDVECPVPLEALAAVTEVLDYLYKLNGQTRQSPDASADGTSLRQKPEGS